MSRILPPRAAFAVIAALALAPAPADALGGPDPASPALELVERLAGLGPRVAGTEAHRLAAELLAERLRLLGLDQVRIETMANGTRNVLGRLPGAEPATGEIALAAHYDTVASSPGASDDAGGCAVVLGALSELRRAPLRRDLVAIFFDGEEPGLLGSDAWIDSLDAEARERILALVDLDLVGLERSGAGVVIDLVGTGVPTPERTPSWLVHAALRAGAAVGFPLRVGSPRLSLLAQLLTRAGDGLWSSDAASALAAGIPAVLLSDFSVLAPDPAMHTPDDLPRRLDGGRLESWATATAAIVRRVDALDGRPRWDEEYLVVAGRVLHRRLLLWIGLVLWIAMVLRGRPGRWAGAAAAERRARGRTYLPGYLFRLLFLVAAFAAPSLSALLVYPLALLSLVIPRTTGARAALAAAGLAPALLTAGLLVAAGREGVVAGSGVPVGQAAAVALALAAFAWQLWESPVGRRGAPAGSRTDGGGAEVA